MIRTKRPGIDVSLVLFYDEGSIPKRIRVKDVATPLLRPIPGYTTGLSGHQRLHGLMDARQYADANQLEMIVIDLLVGFTKPMYPNVLPPELVADHDVLNMSRASKSLIAEIAEHWQEWIEKEEGAGALDKYDWARPTDFMARRPEFLPRLLKDARYKHINVVIHPVLTTFSDRPLVATSIAKGYEHITRAVARFHPNIEVVL